MSNVYQGTIGLIGHTPLVEVVNIEKEQALEATLLVRSRMPRKRDSSMRKPR